jgi:ABC-type uncharacterized transport system ATPase subunit
MKIDSVKIENLLGLKVIKMEQLGDIVKIIGANGAGKSRIISAILAALKYDGLTTERRQLLLNSDGKVEIELSDQEDIKQWTITRTFKNGVTKIYVKNKEGLSGNAKTIAGFIDKNFVDLNRFISLSTEKQTQSVLELVGLKEELKALEQKKDEKYKERQAMGVVVKQLNPGLEPEVDKELPVIGDIESKRLEITEHNIKVEKYNQELKDRLEEKNKASKALKEALGEKEHLEKQLKECNEEIERQVAIEEKEERGYQNIFARKDEYQLKSTAEIDEIAEKARIREKQEWKLQAWKEKNELHEKKRDEYNNLTAEIEEVDIKKKNAIKDTKFPIPGLSYDGKRLTMNGNPLTSDGQFRVVAFAIAKALSGDLSVATFENFSLLDKKNQGLVIEDARKAGFQLFIEMVGVEKEDNSFFIEEGEIKNE